MPELISFLSMQFVLQIGESDHNSDPGEDNGPYVDTHHMMEGLQNVGFEYMHTYDEGHSHFSAPWAYLVNFKDAKAKERWYRTAAEIDIELHTRMKRTKSGKPPLRFFDAATMMSYQVPSKAQEATYCRKEAKPSECDRAYFLELGAKKSTAVYSPVFSRHFRQRPAVGESTVLDFYKWCRAAIEVVCAGKSQCAGDTLWGCKC